MKSRFGWQTKKIIISIRGLLKKREYEQIILLL